MGSVETNKGKTSGSRVAFLKPATRHILHIHKLHPRNIINQYALRLVIEELKSQHKL